MRTIKYTAECWSIVLSSIWVVSDSVYDCVYFQSRAGIKSNFSCLMQPRGRY